MNKEIKKIGIWGLGIMGHSAVSYLSAQGIALEVFEKKELTQEQKAFLAAHQVTHTPHLEQFLENNSCILPSPGIDLRPYAHKAGHFVAELDLFATACTTPLIAITGSVGKTSTTQLITQALILSGEQALMGGNIGVGCFDLINQQHQAQRIVLEVSSFQLELCKQFAPEIAIITNLYPNHLDRHGTFEQYIKAKLTMVEHQKPGSILIAPLNSYPFFHKYSSHRTIYFFSTHRPTAAEFAELTNNEHIIFLDGKTLCHYTNGIQHIIYTFNELPELSFIENWICTATLLYALQKPLTILALLAEKATLKEHRLQKVATVNGITFYNDSKSTLPVATLAAIAKLHAQPIHLLLGGISKGVNRREFIAQLKNKVKYIYCFGSESTQLAHYCQEFEIPCASFATLEDTFAQIMNQAAAHETVLLSPAGASYDLFKDYQERGNRFMELVKQLS